MPSLQSLNTFGVEVNCSELIVINELVELMDLSFSSKDDYYILGGGSNILLTQSIQKPIILNQLKGRDIVWQDEDVAHVVIQGGENWHETVRWALSNNFGGIENLSLIPGTVGAGPIQNIGAYGVELQDVILEVHSYDMLTHTKHVFKNIACEFGYRDSIFKHEPYQGRHLITAVKLKLHRDVYKVNTSYGIIESTLKDNGITKPTIQDVSDAVISIRQSKLPDPKVLGNSGSFFKNPIVAKSRFEELALTFPQIPSYPISDKLVKIPAAWLIDQCGWKGCKIGHVGNYEHQALILVNYGGASGEEIYTHAKNVKQSVLDVFGIDLDFEVNIL